MKNQFIRLAIDKPLLVYVFTAVLSLTLGLLIPKIHIDTDPENMLPDDQPDRVFHNQVEERFALHDAIIVGMVNRHHPAGIYNPTSLGKLHRLSNAILAMEGVIRPDLMSLSAADNITQADANTIRFEWLMKDAPSSQEQSAAIRHNVERLPLLMNTLVSGDGKAAAIYVPIISKDLSYPISRAILALTETLGGEEEFHITGLPVAEDTFGHEMFVQMGISAPLAGLMIFLLMWFFFRNIRLVLAPMIVAMVTVISTMGLLIGLGFTVHIMSSMIPIFLMPIAVVDSIHIMSEFADRYQDGDQPRDLVKDVVSHLFKPMLYTSLTSAAGFASLLLTPIPPVQVFGAFVAFGILLAFIVTITFIPAYIVRMSPDHLHGLERLKAGSDADSALAKALRWLGRFAFSRYGLIISISLLLTIVSVIGVMRIEINDNPVRWFKEQHRIRIADKVLNAHFAGTYDAFLVLEQQDSKAVKQLLAQFEAQLLSRYPLVAEALQDIPESAKASDFDPLINALDDILFSGADADTAALEQLMQQAEQIQSSLRYFQQPQAVALIEGLQATLAESGLIGKTNALPDAIKVVNRELRSGDDADYRVPDNAPGIAQTLLQYQSSHRPHDLWHLVTPDYNAAAIWLQLTSGDNQDMSQVMSVVENYLAQHPLPAGVTSRWAGKTYINVIWQQAMVSGMLKSLLGAFVAVVIMMIVLFRSLRYGLLAMIPLSLTILGAYGLIGWVGKDYDMPIAVLSALSLGLSVDFAIHFIQRMRDMWGEYGDFEQAKSAVFEEPARAIARNAIVIGVGFTPLLFAPLTPYVTVGIFMVLIMLISGIATLIILPALLGAMQSHKQLIQITEIYRPYSQGIISKVQGRTWSESRVGHTPERR